MKFVDRETYESWKTKPASETFELIEAARFGESLVGRVCRTITAFLNSSGGLIIVTVPGESPSPGIVDELYMGADREIAPRPKIDIEVVGTHLGAVEMLFIDVPAGTERPYVHKGQILLRHAAAVRVATRQEILTLIGEQEDPDARWERQVVPGAAEKDLEGERIEECSAREDVTRAVHSWKSSSDERFPWPFLRYFHLGRQPLLRNSAIVLFGRNPTVFVPQVAVRMVAYDAEESHAQEITDDKTFSRNMFDNIEDCFSFLERHSTFSSRFPTIADKTFRRESQARYPFSALREAILNALVHRNFSAFDSMVTVKITPSRIEIWNPGSFPPGTNLNKLEEFRVSRPANPDIAHVLQRMGFIERLGSGINRIIKAFEAADLPKPRWQEVGGGIRLTLNVVGENRHDIRRLAESVLMRLENGEVLSGRRLAAVADVPAQQFRAIVDYLLKEGALSQVGPSRYRVEVGPTRRP